MEVNVFGGPKEQKPIHQQLLSELLRPQQFTDLTLLPEDKDRLERMATSGAIMNMIFLGKPGSGKTSAARLIMKVHNGNSITSTGAYDDYEAIAEFPIYCGFKPGLKICFIDDADALPKSVQVKFASLIEEATDNCRFLFAINDIRKLIDPLQSRLTVIRFDIAQEHRANTIRRLLDRYEQMLPELGITYDATQLKLIVESNFPDLRVIANQLEYEFGLVLNQQTHAVKLLESGQAAR